LPKFENCKYMQLNADSYSLNRCRSAASGPEAICKCLVFGNVCILSNWGRGTISSFIHITLFLFHKNCVQCSFAQHSMISITARVGRGITALAARRAQYVSNVRPTSNINILQMVQYSKKSCFNC